MRVFIVQKRSVSIGIALTALTLFTIFYVGCRSNHNYIVPHSSTLHLNHPESQQQQHVSSVRVCCLTLTSPRYFLTRAKAINNTWGPRCDGFYFITESSPQQLKPEEIKAAATLPIAPIQNIIAGYDHLTQKSTLAFLYAYEHFRDKFDWFIKADDDTYLIVEHLKAFLREQNTSEPITFGFNFKIHVPKGFHSGGAAYVLSREALRRFFEAHQDPNTTCRKDGGGEDVEIARCLRSTGVYPGKSLDSKNRERFHPLNFADHFRGSFPDWLILYGENPPAAEFDCCSDQTISFHHVIPSELYMMDFLLYRSRSLLTATVPP